MLPLFIISSLVLFVFSFFVFSAKKLSSETEKSNPKINKKMFLISVLFLICFIVAIELDLLYYIALFIFLFYSIFYPKAIAKTDWGLILLFMIMFVDFHIISEIQIVNNLFYPLKTTNSSDIYAVSALVSQIVSNVPASIFIAKFSHNWLAISYGVNIGGNGFFIASLANIIAIRFVADKTILLDFHKYSILYMFATGILAFIVFLL